MKKFSFLSLCALMVSFVSTGAFAVKFCDDYGITQSDKQRTDKRVLIRKGNKYSVYSCGYRNNGKSPLELKMDVDFCDDAQHGCPDGYTRKETLDKGSYLCVDDGAVERNGKDDDGAGYYVLKDWAGKPTACFACSVGYEFDNHKNKCIERNSQSCGELVGDACKDKPAYLIISDSHGCYSCKQKEKGSCSGGNRVYAQSAYLGGRKNATEEVDSVWTCLSFEDRWQSKKLEPCPGGDKLYTDYMDGNAKKVIVNPDRTEIHNNASSFVVSSDDMCYEYVCDADKGYIEQDGKCVVISGRQEYCTKNGGEYSNGKCTCSKYKGLKPSDDGETCQCTTDDHVWDLSKKTCVKDPALIAHENKKQACEKSGGVWGDDGCVCEGAHLVQSGEKCACVSGYRWNSNSSACVMTDTTREKKECDDAEKAGEKVKWDGKECKCNDNRMVFINNECVLDENIERCEKIKDAYWDWNVSGVDKCRCINPEYVLGDNECVLSPDIAKCRAISGAYWDGKDCKCENPDMELNGAKTACVETAASIAKKRAGVAYDALRKIHDEFEGKRSVWKDKSGNFNTARLASDSIAGVVLGTAGGLITSNVVKKNQIESGFEDIKCTIGGQNVADWGDQFRVGIQ